MATESDLYLGAVLNGRWRVDGAKAAGGFSVVLHGTDLDSGSPIAVKILKIGSGADAEEEMRGEIRFLRRLQTCDRVVDIRGDGKHPLIVSAGPGGSVQLPIEVTFLVLELADACLTDLLVVLDHVSWRERLQIFRDVVKGIHQMHLKRIASRDLKSENVLLFSPNLKAVAKVADLGRARCTAEPPRFRAEEYLVGRGDLRFAPPELLWWQGTDDPGCWRAVDLYHLGSVLFELAVGHCLTSTVLPDALSILNSMASTPASIRKTGYDSRIADLRARMEFAWELFDAEVPGSIRPQASTLLRQLTDPDPSRRVHRIRGRALPLDRGLEWLIRRADILRLTLAKADAQAASVASRKRRGA